MQVKDLGHVVENEETLGEDSNDFRPLHMSVPWVIVLPDIPPSTEVYFVANLECDFTWSFRAVL